jgi:hypothetical protein
MALILALAIAVLVVLFVAAPFILGVARRQEGKDEGPGGSEAARDLLAEKETLYAAIQELDFDFTSGKLSEADHRSLREKYERQAATLLMREDALDAARRPAGEPRKPKRERKKA